MTMTPGPTATPGPRAAGQPQSTSTDALGGLLSGDRIWWLCLVIPVTLLVGSLLFINWTHVANWWVEKKALDTEERRIKTAATRVWTERNLQQAAKERFQLQNEIRQKNALETDAQVVQLEKAIGLKHEPIGEHGSKVLELLLRPHFEKGFTVKDIRDAAAHYAGVPMRFTERYLQIIRHIEKNRWPLLVFNERTYLCVPARREDWDWQSRPRWVVQEVNPDDFYDPRYFKRCHWLYHPPLRMFNVTESQRPYAEYNASQTIKHVPKHDQEIV